MNKQHYNFCLMPTVTSILPYRKTNTNRLFLILPVYRCVIRWDNPKPCPCLHLVASHGDGSAHVVLVTPSLTLAVTATLSRLEDSCVYQSRPDPPFSPVQRPPWLTAHPRHIEPSTKRVQAPKLRSSCRTLLIIYHQAWISYLTLVGCYWQGISGNI